MKITKRDPFTGQMNTLNIPKLTQKMIDDWSDGMLIQQAMPELTPDEREFLMTGLMPDSWDRLFKE